MCFDARVHCNSPYKQCQELLKRKLDTKKPALQTKEDGLFY